VLPVDGGVRLHRGGELSAHESRGMVQGDGVVSIAGLHSGSFQPMRALVHQICAATLLCFTALGPVIN